MSGDEHRADGSCEPRINQIAAGWIAKQDRGFTADEQDAFFEWLAENPVHSEAYSRRKIVWNEMNVLADWRPEHSMEPNPDLLAISPLRPKLVWVGALAGIAALLAIGLFIGGRLAQSKPSESSLLASGEGAKFYEYHVLEDGSAVELNRGAQVSLRFSQDKRLVDLLAGEAHFTVAKDSRRPFVVRARGTVVQAVGTAFNVLVNEDEVEVIVVEGRVLMNPSITSTRKSLIDQSEPLVREVSAGQRSVVPLGAEVAPPAVEAVSVDQIEARLAWKNDMLDFTNTPLSEVILEFNRRNHTQLVIGDPGLAALPVTAAFRPNKLNEFVELLTLMNGVEAERDGLSKIILRDGNR